MYSGKQSLSGGHFSRGPFSNGSATLQFIFSSGAGVLFVLLLADLSSYLRASSATHQVLVATMRCITPTDADCLSGEALPGVNPQQIWRLIGLVLPILLKQLWQLCKK